MNVTATSNAAEVWAALTRGFAGDTAVCNWILSAVSRNRPLGDDSSFRYWFTRDRDAVTALGFFSAGSRRLDVTPMNSAAATTMAELVHAEVGELVGVLGPVAAVASFAGRWTELADVGARPTDGGRVYEATSLTAPSALPPGRVRAATLDDLGQLVTWNAGFAADTDVAAPSNPEVHLSAQVASGTVWLWEDDGQPQAMSMRTSPAMSTRRIAHVYTPPEHRGRGLAGGLVHHLAAETLGAGDRCMLHTQLANPSSNGVYRRLGFEAISESAFYEFLP